MKEFVISEAKAETAVLVGLVTQTQDEAKTKEYLDELEFLADTAGAVTVKRFTQRVNGPSSVTYVGKGKLDEIRQYIQNEEDADREIGMVIFDDELTAKQIRNIEAALKVKILDRTSLILDIFAMRAQTANAKTQVELAQYRYMLPRLQRLWTHLERQGGGSGSGGGKGSVGLRGPGETQLEMDRRIILQRITLLKQRLVEIDKQKVTQRKNRGRLIRVALVGYTNVGKSTIMNMLAKSEVFAENKLFATLDTTVRKVVIENLPFLLADTVGFIRKLPTDLVDSFKSTLDEVRHYNYSYLYYAYMDSVKVNWNVRANDSTLTIQNFPMKVFVENIVDKNMREALQNDSIHSIPSRVVLYRPWGTTGTLQNAYFNFIPKGSSDFTVEIPLEIDGVEKKVSFIFNSVYMNSTYSVGAFNTNEMAFNMILKQLKIEGERTYDANTLVVIYGKKS